MNKTCFCIECDSNKSNNNKQNKKYDQKCAVI